MSDIRTVEKVKVADFVVRVARQEVGDHYDAAVVAHKKSSLGVALGQAFGDSSEYHTVEMAPIAEHAKKYVAVGKAVEEYLDSGEIEADE
jgi:hypothetical protein